MPEVLLESSPQIPYLKRRKATPRSYYPKTPLYRQPLVSIRRGTKAWRYVSDAAVLRDPDTGFWWNTTGYALAVLLYRARYSMYSQLKNLDFFACHVAPHLGAGPRPESKVPQWNSFMTDDGTPIELSWDWGWNKSGPTVRYSVEPIGRLAGTPADLYNEYAASQTMQRLQRRLPGTNLELFNHFSEELLAFDSENEKVVSEIETHQSRFFVAFDLHDEDVVVKAYFLPAFKAQQTGKSKLEVVAQALTRLPDYEASEFKAFTTLSDFVISRNLAVEIFAIDCISPRDSRFKLYIRSRSTSFDSVCDVLALGKSNNGHATNGGLRELKELWDLVVDGSSQIPSHEDLPCQGHRTAGILYTFEVRRGQSLAVPKVYIPVRHYGRDDHSIAMGLVTYLHRRGEAAMAKQYLQSLREISPRKLRGGRGAQTYIGCTINQGSLKLISYMNPEVFKNCSM